ncbi:nuclear transport factor 2 family protein [Sphingomonas sp.]|uniref:nuclear transport factor 2 family protein n=1 Tax=Sphingomonas sp. TaxID=28214 RepID=UPI00286B9B39|nr:nuclear transport factor 2 family protein [Sphingomonas sp.]
MTAIDAWHAYVRSPDAAALSALLDSEATFDSPIVHKTQHGKSITAAYLTAATQVLGTADFRYIGEWRSDTGAVLEFETVIDGITINGVDIIRLTDDRQRIAAFKVMIRPLKAVNLVHQKMAEMLARSG